MDDRQLTGFRLIEYFYPPDLVIPLHSHSCVSIGILLKGAFVDTYGRKNIKWNPWTVGFHPSSEEHSHRISSRGARVLHVEVGEQWAHCLAELLQKTGESIIFRGGRLSWLAANLVQELRYGGKTHPLIIEGIILEMLGQVSRETFCMKTSTLQPWLVMTKEIIDSNYASPLKLEELSRRSGVNSTRLSRSFRKVYGHSIGAYLRKRRIQAACELLSSRINPSLAKIAADVGFYDQSHFCRVFKRMTGLTPAQYRTLCS
ncbi:AraC family transcriptional regulator [bacterium]|nr:AraC family transcriptional regulator [bacterium]